MKKPRFKIGDTVYTIHDTVSSREWKVSDTSYLFDKKRWHLTYNIQQVDGGMIVVYESEIFKTKEEMLKKLFYSN